MNSTQIFLLRPRHKALGRRVAGALFFLALSFHTLADVTNSVSFSFTNGILPEGTTVFGSARATNDSFGSLGGYLSLTRTVGCFDLPAEDLGSFIVNDINGGRRVDGFDVSFRKSAVNDCSRESFDRVGYSFCWGTDLTNGAFGELGSGTNLIVSFVQTDGGAIGYINVYWRDVQIHNEMLADARTVIPGANYGPVRITLSTAGVLTVSSSDGLFAPHVFSVTLENYEGLIGARFGWGAVSHFNSPKQHRIDDLSITATRQSGEIAGRVTRAGQPEAGVTMTLLSNGVQVATFQTGSDGTYRYDELNGDSLTTYRVLPSKAGLTFNQDERTFTGSGTNADFQVIVYAGRVIGSSLDSSGVPGITISVTNAADPTLVFSAVTGADGRFVVVGMPRGAHLIGPSRGALQFVTYYFGASPPAYLTLGDDNDSTINSQWRTSSPFIAGYVRAEGLGFPGVTVSGAGSDVTDEQGVYILTGPFENPSFITATMGGNQFFPAPARVPRGEYPSQMFQNFDAAWRVAGRVLDAPHDIASYQFTIRLPNNTTLGANFQPDGTFALTVPAPLADAPAKLEMPILPGGARILPQTFLLSSARTDFQAHYFAPPEQVTLQTLSRSTNNFEFFARLPSTPITLNAIVAPISSAFELDTAPPSQPATYNSDSWGADKRATNLTLEALDFVDKAAFGAVYPPAATERFGLEVTNWPVALTHGSETVYTFYLTSDDGAALYLDGDLLLANNLLQGPNLTYNFNGDLPANSAIFGSAYVSNGVLELNPNTGGQSGAFRSEVLAPGQSVAGFSARFRARLNYAASGVPADGFSFNWATDLPDGAYGENGAGSGLRVSFDTYNNAPGEPGFKVWWGNTLITNVAASFIATNNDTFADVAIRLYPSGTLDLSYKGETVFTGVPIPGYAPLIDARIGIGARTGGAWETHGIDDLSIQVYVQSHGGAVTKTATVSLPGSGDQPHNFSLQYVGAGGNPSLKVEWARTHSTNDPMARTNLPGPVNATFVRLPTVYTNLTLLSVNRGCDFDFGASFTPRHLGPVTFTASMPSAVFTPSAAVVPPSGSAAFIMRGGYAGRVLDPDGEPLVGITIRVGTTTNEECGIGSVYGRLVAQATTDANGQFSIDPAMVFAGPLLFMPISTSISFDPPFVLAGPRDDIQFTSRASRPRFGPIANQVMYEDTTLNVPFTVSDLYTPAELITLSASSGNQSIIPNSGLTLGGSGSNRTLTIRPEFNANSLTPVQITLKANNRGAGDGAFFVRTVQLPYAIQSVGVAKFYLDYIPSHFTNFFATAPLVNFTNDAGSGHFSGAMPFPGLTSATNHFIVEIIGTVHIPTSGDWTFGVRSDDGFECVLGANTFGFDEQRGSADTLATYNLAAGSYPVRILYFENEGGADLQFFAAPGSHGAFNSNFRLVGDTTNGGLAAGGTDRSVTFNVIVNPVNDPPTAGTYTAMAFQNNRLLSPGTGGPMLDGEMTLEFWQKVTASQPHESVGVYPGQGEKYIRAYTPYLDGNVYFDYGDWRGPGRLSYTPPVDANIIGSWQHWAFVVSKNTNGGAMKIYRNGALEAERNSVDGFAPGAANLLIGGLSYQGELAEFRVWNVARSVQEIQLTKDSPLRGDEVNLLVYYRFLEGSGPMVHDSATLLGGTNNATLIDNPPPTWLENGLGYVHDLPADEDTITALYLPAFDFDSPFLTYTIATSPAHGTLTQTNGYGGAVWNYLPATNYYGPDSFRYTVTDGAGATASATVFLSVSNVNDVPIISTIPNQTITESQLSAPIAFTVTDGDGFPELLEITAQSSDLILLRPENIRFHTNSPTSRSLTIQPEFNQIGTLTITLSVSDGLAQISTRFDVRIEPRPAFSIVELGAPSGKPITFGTAINDRGAVAAYGAVNNLAQQPRGFVNQGVDNGLYVTELGTLGGATATALGINRNNDVVGEALTSEGATHAYKSDGVTMLDLGTLTGGSVSRATAINDGGAVCGFATTSGVKNRAFLWLPGGSGMQNLGTLAAPYHDSSQAFAINTDSDVVGASFAANGQSHAFFRSAITLTMQDLGTLGGNSSVARGINRFGHVVGSADTSGGTRAFIWRNGVMTSLGTLPGGGDSEARSINEFGQIVGFAFNSNGTRRATLFTQGQLFDLNDVVPEAQQNAGWILTEANAINSRGEIVGTGTKNGQTRAFLVVPAAVIGRQVARPQGSVARRPEIELLNSESGDTAENSFFWSEASGEKKLYATRPVTARIKWGVTDSQLDTNRIVAVSISVWPKFPQIHVSTAPVEIEPAIPGFAHKYIETRYTTIGSDAMVNPNTKVFTATNPAYTVLMYLRNNGASPDPQTQPPYFEVARTLAWDDARHFLAQQPATIGPALTSPFHRDHVGRNGYIYFPHCFIDSTGEEAAYHRDERTGPILPVNRLKSTRSAYADPLVVIWYATNRINVSWGYKAVGYQPDWDTNAPQIVIASGEGGGYLPPNLFQDIRLYNQPHTNLPGFNPNEEHALILPGPSGETVYALRNDLNDVADYSDPYALLKYRDPQANFEWRILPHRVVITNASFPSFAFNGDVGKEIQPPFPLSVFNLCAGSKVVSGPGWKDKNGRLYARAAGPGLNDPVQIVARYLYPLQPAFHYDVNRDGLSDAAMGTCIPWLDRRPNGLLGQSIDVTYSIRWPTNAPTLKIGETLLRARNGLPDLANFSSAEIIFDSTNPNHTNYAGAGTRLFDPLSARVLRLHTLSNLSVAGASYQLPADLKRTREGGRETFDDLPPDLIGRLSYDPLDRSLSFAGTLDENVVGQPLLLLNVMTPRERDRILSLVPGGTNAATDWNKVITALYRLTRNPGGVDLDPRDGQPDDALRLGLANQYTVNSNGLISLTFTRPSPTPTVLVQATNVVAEPLGGAKALIAAGFQQLTGPRFITIAENNTPSAEGPVALHVIRVEGGPFAGDLKLLTTANIFSEKLSIRHSADFGGEPERLSFEWYYKPDSAAFDPTDLPRTSADGSITDPRGWLFYSAITPTNGAGVNSLTLGEGGESSLLVLGDNWFIGRYRGYNVAGATNWTDWVGDPASGGTPRAALAEGWVKRVVRALNPFDARTADFHSSAVNTFASMLQQAGRRYEGDIAFNADADAINSVGLIEAYSTVLHRGQNLSIDGIPAVNFDPANNALLLAASKISDLYMLLGNDAYADAQDPTIGFGTTSGDYGTAASSIFAFQNQTDSLLEEELGLLRGRDDRSAGVGGAPVYNRLFWNFTLGEGEVAYRQAYNITDVNRDGFLDEHDARLLYPQGHGDAWGHYLTALKTYYALLRHPKFTWVPRTENVLVAGAAVQVDFLDERKFARAAAAKARAAAEIVNLTYRQQYVDDTTGQWQGYKDTDPDRSWGVTEWARRAGQAAMFDWVTANALLFATDPNPDHTGLQKIDRQTVLELAEIPAQLGDIQKQLDQADIGLNPIGLVKGAVPFDIDPTFLEVGSTAQIGRRAVQGLTQFDQILERAISALNNAVKVWNQANKATELLRRNQDSVEEFTVNVIDQERDYKNRLIEIFGYPYAGDIGAGKTYPSGYDGPDTYHWMYVNTREIAGETTAPVSSAFSGFFQPVLNGVLNHTFFPGSEQAFFRTFDTNTLETSILQVNYPYAQSAASYTFVAPAVWGQRRAPGKIQEALSDLVQQEARMKQALQNYDGLIRNIQDALDLLAAQHRVNATEIQILNRQRNTITSMNAAIGAFKATQVVLSRVKSAVFAIGDSASESVPRIAGLAFDVGAPVAGAIKGAAAAGAVALGITEGAAQIAENSVELAKERVGLTTEIDLTVNSQSFEVLQRVKEIEAMMRDEAVNRLEVFNQREAVSQAVGRYHAALAEGDRLLQELTVFRQRAAAQTSASRYQDMTFRIFRHDALQKYRAAFDLAARYVYLAANAYDYEVNFNPGDARAGRDFLTDIIRQRGLGEIVDGDPAVGQPGLADPLARLEANWAVLKTQFGVINPQITDTRFSLREEMFRINGDEDSDAAWREALTRTRLDNLWDLPEFRRYCRPFIPESAGPQPGLVLRFPTTITFGLNYFGWPLAGGDNNYDPAQFSTKIARAGVWLSGSDGTQVSQTPRVYLVPVGMDVMRSPSGDTLRTREWRIVDQAVPPPFPIGPSSLSNPNWIPQFDSIGGTFADIRRYGAMIAKHDDGIYAEDDLTNDTRLIGRSAWNTDWLLIIPGGTLLNDPDAGLETFINTVSDIKIYFQTYSYSGN